HQDGQQYQTDDQQQVPPFCGGFFISLLQHGQPVTFAFFFYTDMFIVSSLARRVKSNKDTKLICQSPRPAQQSLFPMGKFPPISPYGDLRKP
ncbi:MAG: hypothetical protein UIK34_00910, partial [Christensenellales bacterium]|nr:hypothetical protein [Christensenellales bacterium]